MADRRCCGAGSRESFSRATESLCPVCLTKVPAALVASGGIIRLEGRCPDHGVWRTPIWSGTPSLESWAGGAGPRVEGPPGRDAFAECPGRCGLCAQHQQQTCVAVLEVTKRCNLECPVCFATASPASTSEDPTRAQLELALEQLIAAQGPVNLQLSGGEPTTRADLAEIITTARTAGVRFVQLNTNGIRLASTPGYAEKLRDAGLSSVFLQFDGLGDDIYTALRGRPLLAEKLQAVEACARADLSVVLVATVVPGVNDHGLGSLVYFAGERPGIVRGVHLQPISYFGRFPSGGRPRMTLPDLLRELERQTHGQLRAEDFSPSGCEHPRCSFRGRYWMCDDGTLQVIRSAGSGCSRDAGEPHAAARRAIQATARQWGSDVPVGVAPASASVRVHEGASAAPVDDLTRFLEGADRILAISGMLFQDAWSMDLERVRRCCVHALVPGRGLVPFCLWNLTGEFGQRFYPRD